MHKNVTFKTHIQKRQRNVVGCYLGYGLKRARHGSDIFPHSKIILYSNLIIKSKYTPQEDQIILDQVAMNGDTNSTWKTLSRILNKSVLNPANIRYRYLRILKSGCYKSGHWTLEEDTVLLESLFENKPRKIETIKSVNHISLGNIDELKRFKSAIKSRFESILKPILLSYHLGILNHNWKYNFVAHILNKKYKASKEVIWEELVDIYPGQTCISLTYYLHSIVKSDKLDFTIALQDHLNKLKNSEDYTEKQKEYRQKIADIYTKCTIPC